ncbi:hypothetical protein CCR75_009701 [Bremia lactucae]|uniref:beta-glucosidase n=1 Tax=Bremia lactucae TaxID=4779 RepID=A0A976FN27_BRELC|nr:hypothetical protein CCR75_009701 [Bremia lactucae]
MLPCELGGQALVEILYGDVNPSGKLPITYPKDSANIAIPYNHLVTTRCQYALCEPEWDFGAGLSYTQWNYSAVTLDRTIVSGADDTVTATVTVTNVGDRAGKETVMLFLIQPIQEISVPNVKMLKKFQKIELNAGESMDVTFTLSEEDWGVYKPQIGKGLLRIVEDTNYVVAIKPDTECNVYNGPLTNSLCAQFTINLSGTPVSSDALYSPVLINGGDSSQSTGAPVNGVDYFQSTGAPVNGVDYYKSTGAPVEVETVHDLTLNSLDNSGAGNNGDVVQLQTSTGVVNTVQPQMGSD